MGCGACIRLDENRIRLLSRRGMILQARKICSVEYGDCEGLRPDSDSRRKIEKVVEVNDLEGDHSL